MLVILPFEKEFYQKWNYEVDYVGHPLVEVMERLQTLPRRRSLRLKSVCQDEDRSASSSTDRPAARQPQTGNIEKTAGDAGSKQVISGIISLLWQRRRARKMLFTMESVQKLSQCVCSANNQTYPLLMHAQAACVTSGTATLETALFGVPEVVCYKGSSVSYQIAKRLIKVKYISLVNLIMDKPVVKELIQDELNVENIVTELKKLVSDETTSNRIKSDYADLRALLSQGGNASEKAAELYCVRC